MAYLPSSIRRAVLRLSLPTLIALATLAVPATHAAQSAEPLLCFDVEPDIVGAGKIKGGPGADVIVGSAGPDTIDGGGGDDLICGGAGNDTIKGSDGNDRIDSGLGNDK